MKKLILIPIIFILILSIVGCVEQQTSKTFSEKLDRQNSEIFTTTIEYFNDSKVITGRIVEVEMIRGNNNGRDILLFEDGMIYEYSQRCYGHINWKLGSIHRITFGWDLGGFRNTVTVEIFDDDFKPISTQSQIPGFEIIGCILAILIIFKIRKK